MGFYDAFFGSEQTQYTAYAILAAVTAICLTVLFSSSDISFGNRLVIIMFVIISVLPSVLLTLFELTCIVTGGTEPNQWWCSTFAWILAAFIIVYCLFIVIISFMSLFTYNNAVDDANKNDKNNKLPKIDSDKYAKQMIDIDDQQYQYAAYKQAAYQQAYNIKVQQAPQVPQQQPVGLIQSPKPITNEQQQYIQQYNQTQKQAQQQAQQQKEPTIGVQALTPVSVISQQTQPVPVGDSVKSSKLVGSDVTKVGTYSVNSIDNFDDYNNKYASFTKDTFANCVVGTGSCH